jgi:glutamate carboxypeptidase
MNGEFTGSGIHMTETAGRLRAWFEDNRDDWLDFLSALVYSESPSNDSASLDGIMTILADAFDGAGLAARRVGDISAGGKLLAVPRRRVRGRPFQVLIGHCDTVWPTGTVVNMPVTQEGNKLSGPGVFDMKAGLANMVFALRALEELRLEPSVTPVALVTSDEEVGSGESRPLIERLARRADRAMVLEPSLGLSGRIKTARKGTGAYRVRVEGKAAHAGLAPEEGASAILEMSHVIQELFALNDSSRGITVNVGTVEGGLRSNVVAPDSHAEVDVRVLTAEDARRVDTVINGLRPATGDVKLSVSGGFERPPMEKTPRNAALWELCRNRGSEIGLDLQEGTAGGASDGNFTSQFCATLDGLGAVGHGAHAHHEHILIDQTLRRAELLTLLLLSPPTARA